MMSVSRRTIIVVLTAIVALASFLRFYHFSSIPPGLYPDEAMDGNSALEAARTSPFPIGMKAFYPENNGREGLYIDSVAVLFKVSGAAPEPWIVRIPAAISGIFTVLGIYFLAAELFGAEAGLLAAFFLATSFWHINFSRLGFRAIMAPLFLTWALYFLLKGFKKLESGAPFHRAASFYLASSVLWALGFYTYIAYRVSPALIVLVFAFYWFAARRGGWQRVYARSAAIFALASAAVAAPLPYYFFTHPGTFSERTSELSVFHSAAPLRDLARNTWKTLAMFNLQGDGNLRHNVIGRPELFWPVGILFLVGIVVGVRSLGRATKPSGGSPAAAAQRPDPAPSTFPFVLLLAWFLLGMLPVVISNQQLPHALRSILMIPCVIMFAAVGGRVLYIWLGSVVNARWLRLATFSFLALLTFEAYNTYFVLWARNPNLPDAFNADYVSLGRELNALPSSTPKYVVIEAPGFLSRGIPVPAQTVMFITDSFSADAQAAKNIHYLLPADQASIPPGASVFYVRTAGSDEIVAALPPEKTTPAQIK
jgi:4-amino-4-deoxy-L-arabinose transferase-like glycosyltransferase